MKASIKMLAVKERHFCDIFKKHYLRLLKEVFEDNYQSNFHSFFMFYRYIINKLCLHFFSFNPLKKCEFIVKGLSSP